MSRPFHRSCALPLLAAAIVVHCLSGTADAQSSITTGDGFLKLQADLPDEVRVGEQFEYTVQVTNTSDNVVLHNIQIKQQKAKGFTVDSVSRQAEQTQKSQSSKEKQKDKDGKTNQKKSSKSSKSGQKADQGMTITMLKPNESQTLWVKATADNEGQLRSCLEVESYTPALCLTSQVVKPQLELTKQAPKKANRCDMIKLEYSIKNGGSGDVGPIVITDSLGEGLATIEGDSELKFDVDGLKAGDERTFVARVFASKSGEFSSRAQAKAKQGDLKSRSKKTSTKVMAADLRAKLDGPNRIYGDKLATFTATITNAGNAPAEDVDVTLMWPQSASLADVSDPTMKMDASGKNSDSQSGQSNQSSEGSSSESKQSPTMAEKKAQSSAESGSKNDASESKGPSMQMAQQRMNLNRLKPGQSAVIEFAVRPNDLDELPTKVKATYTCTVDAAQDVAKAEAKATATATSRAKIVRLPALQMVVIDDEDPVTGGNEVVYTIRVWNEGDAVDNDVKVTADLPEGLEFVSADGPTKSSQSGSSIQFEPIEKMEPGDRSDFKITAKADGTDNVRFAARLESKKLSSEVTAEEPTRLFRR